MFISITITFTALAIPSGTPCLKAMAHAYVMSWTKVRRGGAGSGIPHLPQTRHRLRMHTIVTTPSEPLTYPS